VETDQQAGVQHAQVTGHRLLLCLQRQALAFDPEVEFVDVVVPGYHRVGQGAVALEK